MVEKLFGVGGEKKTTESGDFVIQESFGEGFSKIEAQSMLYLSMIFHLLFPKNLPQPIGIKANKKRITI